MIRPIYLFFYIYVFQRSCRFFISKVPLSNESGVDNKPLHALVHDISLTADLNTSTTYATVCATCWSGGEIGISIAPCRRRASSCTRTALMSEANAAKSHWPPAVLECCRLLSSVSDDPTSLRSARSTWKAAVVSSHQARAFARGGQ